MGQYLKCQAEEAVLVVAVSRSVSRTDDRVPDGSLSLIEEDPEPV